MQTIGDGWERLAGRREPWPLITSALLLPLLTVWTLPQSLTGLVVALYRRIRGEWVGFYRFGPFLFVVVRARFPWTRGISLGTVVFAETPDILKHEFCHLFTGLWLSWTYLIVYGLEYLIVGHERSLHERTTVRIERALDWSWEVVSRRKPVE